MRRPSVKILKNCLAVLGKLYLSSEKIFMSRLLVSSGTVLPMYCIFLRGKFLQ